MKPWLKGLFFVIIILAIVGAAVSWYLYNAILGPAIPNAPEGQEVHELFIPTGASFEQVIELLDKQKLINNKTIFVKLAEQMNYPRKIRSGRYLLEPNWSNRKAIQHLRSGEQEPIRLTIHNIRTKGELIERIHPLLEADSVALATILNDTLFLSKNGFNSETVISAFISDTYLVNWNSQPKDFYERMFREYKNYWNPDRKAKAAEWGLSPLEVISLAAIVEEETQKTDEMPRVAGVYINRLRKEWPLQADPTVKFAVGDFTLKRILNKHLEVDSPYNTYKYPGLPPGPIRIPSKKALNAVINAETHKYMYFCAKEDFSGYHNFATNLQQHNINARKYQRELNRLKIK